MGLWIFYCDAHDDDIEMACQAAVDELTRRGFTAQQAQDAALDSADLAEDYVGETTPNADAVVAWWNAEDVALRALYAQTGDWPASASLIYTVET